MNTPNKLTVARMIIVPFLVVFLLSGLGGDANRYISLILFVVASITDWFDGHLARKNNLVTNFGKFMDPLADKLLVCSAMICMIELNRLPAWVVIIIIGREFIISGFRLIAAENGIVSGYEDGTFRPENTITREEFATMICRLKKYDTSVTGSFSDVPADHWAASYIAAMKANGIIGGYEDGSFGLGKNITRAEAIAIINRATGRVPTDEKIRAYVATNGNPFTDIEGHWAAAQIIEATVEHELHVLH